MRTVLILTSNNDDNAINDDINNVSEWPQVASPSRRTRMPTIRCANVGCSLARSAELEEFALSSLCGVAHRSTSILKRVQYA
jgi:hypothetical protein